MKLKILKKSIKEGEKDGKKWCIKSLYVSVATPNEANELAKLILEVGGESDQIPNMIRKSEYEGETTYGLWLNCSNFTFDKVERFGILEAKIIYVKNKNGYINAKIEVIEGKEQIDGYEVSTYESQEDDVTGWNVPAPENLPPSGDGSHAEPNPIDPNPLGLPNLNSLNPSDVPGDLPF